MRVFLSWSGPRSKRLAFYLHEWIRAVVQRAEPWMSDRDIQPGQRWSDEISSQLRDTHFGVICLTPENMNASWLLFEAGALAKAVESARVVPVLLGVAMSDLTYPLAQFHALSCDESGLRSLAASINNALGTDRLPAPTLDSLFSALWPSLSAQIASIPGSAEDDDSSRTDRQLLEELVEGLHLVQRSLPSDRDGFHSTGDGEGDWEDYYLKGVNLANQRGDPVINTAALRAYSNAIALMPSSLEDNTRSRLYTYRAAVLKRLGRLEEAEQDLVLGQRWATGEREIEDVLYNLACVLAMGRAPEDALPILGRLITRNSVWMDIVLNHPYYFRKLLDDPGFRKLTGQA
jgi:hypothetical protein